MSYKNIKYTLSGAVRVIGADLPVSLDPLIIRMGEVLVVGKWRFIMCDRLP